MDARLTGTILCRFLCFYLILFLVHCNALAMFRMFAALTRDMVVANSVGSCFLVVFLMLSGYIFAQSARPAAHYACEGVARQQSTNSQAFASLLLVLSTTRHAASDAIAPCLPVTSGTVCIAHDIVSWKR